MMTGRRPFDDDSVHKLLDKIIIGEFKFPPDEYKFITDDAKDLIRNILNPNPRKRFNIDQIKFHRWFQTGGYEEDELLSHFNGNWSASEIPNFGNNIDDNFSLNFPPNQEGISRS